MAARHVPRTLEKLVEAQVRRWELQEQAARAAARSGGPCVALSRLPGAGGSEVAHHLAERLDYGVFDRQMVDEIARQSGMEQRLVEGLDERVRSAIDRYVTDSFRLRPGLRESDYARAMVRVVQTLARRGATVVVGRGAPFVLSEQQALRVLLVAPREVRLERFAASRGIPAEEAAPLLDELEAERNEFARVQFHVEQTDPHLYDLCLNTGTLGIALAEDLVVAALQSRFAKPKPESR